MILPLKQSFTGCNDCNKKVASPLDKQEMVVLKPN
jgi:hypothetical protein